LRVTHLWDPVNDYTDLEDALIRSFVCSIPGKPTKCACQQL
jgi:hypothetical protein